MRVKLAKRFKIFETEDERLRHSDKFVAWRKRVFIRDRYTCQQCGKDKCVLNPHHIRMWARYPKLRFVTDNGITLCEDCHKKTFGQEEYLAEKFERIIQRKKLATQKYIKRQKRIQNKKSMLK